MNKAPLAALAALVVLGGAVAFQSLSGPDAAVEQRRATAPTTTVSLAPAPEDDATAEPTKPSKEPRDGQPDGQQPRVQEDAARVAEQAIVAYTEYSWRDASPTAWIDRVGAYGTEGFEHGLIEQFRTAEDPYWDREVVPNQRETRTEVTDVVVDGMHEQTAKRVVYAATFTTSLKTKDMAEWGEGDPMTLWVYLVDQGGSWLVTDIVATDSRVASDF